MNPDRWRQIDDLLHQVRERPVNARAAFLEEVCGDDSELREEIESLLAFDERTAFLDEPAYNIHDEETHLGRRLGPYEIVRLLGRGGMGKVYLATRRDDFDQKVAIKLIKAGLASREIQRFHNERQILADLDHPNIARLLDGGTDEKERPYFVMEYVEGEPIDRYCDRRQLSLRKRLELFRQVCSAVQFSHQKLIVHRDIKPGNVLVTRDDGVPKLLDFGIAKMLGSDRLPHSPETRTGRRPMTPKYASPEQILGDNITTASDTYSLGVLLFKLLTGHHPFEEERSGTASEPVILLRVLKSEAPKPSTALLHRQPEPIDSSNNGAGNGRPPGGDALPETAERRRLARRLKGDLDAIVLKAMRKEPDQRYGSVEQLSEDIRRHLVGLPVTAHRGNFSYRAGKFIRRNRLALAVVVSILVTALTAIMLWQQADQERQRADRVISFMIQVFESSDPDNSQKDSTTSDLLARGRRELVDILEEDPKLWTAVVDTLGRIHHKTGVYDEALELMEASLRALRRDPSNDDPEIAKRLNNIAVLHFERGNYVRAEENFREAWAMLQRLGLDDVDVVNYLNNLATILTNRGAFDEAEDIYRRGLDLRIEAYGCEHPRIATSLRSLGNLLYLRGDLDRAERYLREAVDIRRRKLGPGHTGVAAANDKLADVLAARGRDTEAETLYRGALAIRLDRFGPNHDLAALTEWKLAGLLLDRGDLEEGKTLLDRASETLQRLKGDGKDDWELAEIQSLYGVYHTRTGNYDEAEHMLIESHALIRAARGEVAIYTHRALDRIIELYEAWGRSDELARYQELAASGERPSVEQSGQPGDEPRCLTED